MPALLIGAYLSPVFLPRIMPAYTAGRFREFFHRFHVVVFAIAGSLLLIALVVGRPVLLRFLPMQYQPSIGIVLILIPGALAVASYIPLTLNFLLIMRPRIFLVLDSIAAPLLAAAYYFFTPTHGAQAAAWITCVYQLVKASIVQARAYAVAHNSHAGMAATPANQTR